MEVEAEGLLPQDITGHFAQKDTLHSRLHHYPEHISHVLKMSNTFHIAPTAPGALCCSFNCCLDTELYPPQAVPL